MDNIQKAILSSPKKYKIELLIKSLQENKFEKFRQFSLFLLKHKEEQGGLNAETIAGLFTKYVK